MTQTGLRTVYTKNFISLSSKEKSQLASGKTIPWASGQAPEGPPQGACDGANTTGGGGRGHPLGSAVMFMKHAAFGTLPTEKEASQKSFFMPIWISKFPPPAPDSRSSTTLLPTNSRLISKGQSEPSSSAKPPNICHYLQEMSRNRQPGLRALHNLPAWRAHLFPSMAWRPDWQRQRGLAAPRASSVPIGKQLPSLNLESTWCRESRFKWEHTGGREHVWNDKTHPWTFSSSSPWPVRTKFSCKLVLDGETHPLACKHVN